MSILEDNILNIDYDAEVVKITKKMKEYLRKIAHRRGFVVAISGGIDSSVCAALAVAAVGKDRVLFLRLPETDSSSATADRSRALADYLGCETIDQNITDVLSPLGCYDWRDSAIKNIYPDYDGSWKNKITISGGQEGMFNHFNLVVQKPDGEILKKRMDLKEYLQIVAATNYKQRIRKTIEYFHADRLNYAVVGTPNRLEFDQGFFVKNGDGAADIKPIAHLYKTQVYALANYLKLPQDIATAVPTTDTYSMDQGQDEFYFALPYDKMDIALWAYNHEIPIDQLAAYLKIDSSHAQFIYDDIVSKRKTTHYLHAKPYLIDDEVLNELKLL